MRRAVAALGAALTAIALTLTACTPDTGTPGRVVDKSREYDCDTTGTGKKRRTSCDWEYQLTTRNAEDEEDTFEVSAGEFADCRRGSKYPSCTDR